jgi:hypothetical protein
MALPISSTKRTSKRAGLAPRGSQRRQLWQLDVAVVGERAHDAPFDHEPTGEQLVLQTRGEVAQKLLGAGRGVDAA